MCRKILNIASVLVFMALLAAGAPACKPAVEALPEPAYAGKIAEGILQALNSGDYAAYSQRFDPAMKKAVPETAFRETAALIQGKIGRYQSKAFDSAYTQEIYTVVIYRAAFSQEDNVKVTVVFLETDEGVLVSGLWLNSPKLQ